MLYLALAAVALLLIALVVGRALTRAAVLTLEDAIVHPGEGVELTAWLERRIFLFVDPDVAGEAVELVGVGASATDAQGRARWSIPSLPPGLHRFRARVAGSKFAAPEAEAVVAVWAADARVLITDVDHTIADVSSFRFLFANDASIRPIAGAPEALRGLAASLGILYLSARDHVFLNRTRAWLRANGFPEGPLLQRRVRFTGASPYEHKMMRLADVVAKLKNIRFGVGDLPADARAYANHGLRPILLAETPPPGVPDGTVTARSWIEVAEIVKRETVR